MLPLLRFLHSGFRFIGNAKPAINLALSFDDALKGCSQILTIKALKQVMLKQTVGRRPSRSFTCQIPYVVTLM